MAIDDNSKIKLYISSLYSDSGGHAGRLNDHLQRHFTTYTTSTAVATENLSDFQMRKTIENHINDMQVMLIVIGRRWLDIIEDDSARHETEIFWFEIDLALKEDCIVIPVLVHDTNVSLSNSLPSSIIDSFRDPSRIDDNHFARDIRHLIDKIHSLVKEKRANSSEYFLPPHIISTMLDYLEIDPDDTVYDPAFGTGELLLSAFNRVNNLTKGNLQRGNIRNNFYGRNLNPETVEIAKRRFRDNDLNSENIIHGNALLQNDEDRLPNQYDAIITNTPFSDASDRERKGFEFPSRYKEALFLQHIMESLKEGGRCAMTLPVAFWMRSGEKIRGILAKLFSDFRVERIYNLEIEQNDSQIGITLLMFSKRLPAQEFDFITESEFGELNKSVAVNVSHFFSNLHSTFLKGIRRFTGTKKSTHRIFISYRRDDSKWATGRLYDNLTLPIPERFKKDSVFLDLNSILPGQNWKMKIEQGIDSCEVILVVIGDKWLHELESRESGDEDWVVKEIAMALQLEKTIIPIILDPASMPSKSSLPYELQELIYSNGCKMNHAEFPRQVSDLVEIIRANYVSD